MIFWLALTLYVLVAIACCARITGLLAWRMFRIASARYPSLYNDDPDGFHWSLGAIIGLVGGLLWPLTIIPLVFRDRFFQPPDDLREQRERKETERLMKELDRG